MDNNKDTTGNNLEQLKLQAEQSVSQKGHDWVINFPTPIHGFDTNKTYTSKDLAIDAAFNALKARESSKVKAA